MFWRKLFFFSLIFCFLWQPVWGVEGEDAAVSEESKTLAEDLAETPVQEGEKPIEAEATPDEEGMSVTLKIDADAVKQLQETKAKPEPILILEDENMDVGYLYQKFQGWWLSVQGFFAEHWRNLLTLPVGILLTSLVVLLSHWFVRRFLLDWLFATNKTDTIEHVYWAIGPPIRGMLWTTGIFFSAMPLLNGAPWLQRLFLAIIVSNVFWAIFRLIAVMETLFLRYVERKNLPIDLLITTFLRKISRILLVLVALFFIGQTILGLNITALLAAAGIAGLAFAFAVKDILANFLSSFLLIFDRSFQIGDRIRTSNIDGVIEKVDLRSTRIRSLEGNVFSIPNGMLSNNIIENVSWRPKIKYTFDLTLSYSTTPQKMREATEILHRLTSNPGRFEQGEKKPQIFFTEFKDWALNINIILWFNTTDWGISQIWRHDLNLEILEAFNQAGLEFAFPTSTVYMESAEPENLGNPIQ
ncbi:MAG: mechanosensitive ion channel family protein [Planctomycetia bacterium]|nr:mechanosensitive ion channel family protein [Planctomycetia bacterium]